MPEPKEDFGFEVEDDLGFEAEPEPVAPAPALPAESVGMAEGPGHRLALQGLTTFGDEIVAGAKSLMGDRTYEEELERERAALEAERARSPNPMLQQLAGSLPLILAPGGARSVFGTVATGAGLGALGGAGAAEGGLAERAKGAATGAVVGAGMGALGLGVGAGLRAGARGLARKGTEAITESIGATPTKIAHLEKRHGGAEALGQKMRKLGLTGTSGQIAKRAAEIGESSGQQIGQIYQAADRAAGGQPVVNVSAVKERIQSLAADISGMPEEAARMRVYNKWLKNLEGSDAETITRMHKRLKALDNQINFGPKKGSQRNNALRDVREIYKQELQGAVEATSPDLLPELQEANAAFSLARGIEAPAERAAALQAGENFFGLRNMAAGAAGGFAFGPAGVAAGLARPLAARYAKPAASAAYRGAAATARGVAGPAQRLATRTGAAAAGAATQDEGRIAGTTETARANLDRLGISGFRLKRAAQKGTEEFNSLHFSLMMSDPEYREQIRKLEGKNDG